MLLAMAALAVACAAIYQLRLARSELVLVDETGRERVRITATNEAGAIELVDERGRTRMTLREANDRVGLTVNRQEPSKDGSPDFAMQYLIDEGTRMNHFQIRDEADQLITLGSNVQGGGLSLRSGESRASLFVSNKLGASVTLEHAEKRANLTIWDQASNLYYNETRLRLDDVFLPRKLNAR